MTSEMIEQQCPTNESYRLTKAIIERRHPILFCHITKLREVWLDRPREWSVLEVAKKSKIHGLPKTNGDSVIKLKSAWLLMISLRTYRIPPSGKETTASSTWIYLDFKAQCRSSSSGSSVARHSPSGRETILTEPLAYLENEAEQEGSHRTRE